MPFRIKSHHLFFKFILKASFMNPLRYFIKKNLFRLSLDPAEPGKAHFGPVYFNERALLVIGLIIFNIHKAVIQ